MAKPFEFNIKKLYADLRPSEPVSYTHLDVYKRQLWNLDYMGSTDGLQAVSLSSAYRRSGDASVDHRNCHSIVSGFFHSPYGTV